MGTSWHIFLNQVRLLPAQGYRNWSVYKQKHKFWDPSKRGEEAWTTQYLPSFGFGLKFLKTWEVQLDSVNTQIFPWDLSPDGPASSLAKLLQVGPSIVHVLWFRPLLWHQVGLGSATLGQSCSRRENLGVAGNIVLWLTGSDHHNEHVYDALQFQRVFHSLQR